MEDGSVNPMSDAGSESSDTYSCSDTSDHDERNDALIDISVPVEVNEGATASDGVKGEEHEATKARCEVSTADTLRSNNGSTSDMSSSNDACKNVDQKESNGATVEADFSAKIENDDDRGVSLDPSQTDNDEIEIPCRNRTNKRTHLEEMSISDRLDNVSLLELNGVQVSCELKPENSILSHTESSIDNVRCLSDLDSSSTRTCNVSDLSDTHLCFKPDDTTIGEQSDLSKDHSTEETSHAERQLHSDEARFSFPNLSRVGTRTPYPLEFSNTNSVNVNQQNADEVEDMQTQKDSRIQGFKDSRIQGSQQQNEEEVLVQALPEELGVANRESEETVADPDVISESESESESGSESESEEETEEVATPIERPVVLRRQTSFQRELADAIVRIAPLDELELLLRCGAKVSEPVTQGLTPLHYAVWQRYPEAAELLIREGCDLNARDDIGYTPLHLCSEHGYLDMMNVLLQHNAHVNFNHPEDEDLYPIDAVDEPLRLALKHDQIEASRLLLENGANPNGRYFFGSEINLVSPLKTELLELLLSWGAQPDTRDRYGFTPIMKACHVQQEAEEELEERGTISGKDVLQHFAQTLKGIESVLVLISHGADINLRTDARHECRSVLHYAILSGSSPIVSLLLKQGAKVNFEPEYNKASPLHLAVLKGDSNIINMLLDAGAVINITTPTVGSPLHVACSEQIPNRMQVLQLLLDRGADPNIVVRNNAGRPLKPPLGEYLANSTDHDVEVVKIMLRYGAQVVMQAPQQCPLGMLNCLYSVAKNKEVMIELLEAAEKFDVPLIRKTPLLVPSSHRELFLDVAANPPSLRHLSRVFVRQVMKNRRPEAVDDLALPKLLRQYLLYEIN